jgi:hypothetical protein
MIQAFVLSEAEPSQIEGPKMAGAVAAVEALVNGAQTLSF